MGVDHGFHRPVSPILAIQIEGGPGSLHRGHRINQDDTVIALDNHHARQIKAADLVDPPVPNDVRGDLEQTVIHIELGLPPQTGIDGRRRLRAGQKAVCLQVPDHLAFIPVDRPFRQSSDEASLGVIEVFRIPEGQLLQDLGIGCHRCRLGVFGQGCLVRAHRLGGTGDPQYAAGPQKGLHPSRSCFHF